MGVQVLPIGKKNAGGKGDAPEGIYENMEASSSANIPSQFMGNHNGTECHLKSSKSENGRCREILYKRNLETTNNTSTQHKPNFADPENWITVKPAFVSKISSNAL